MSELDRRQFARRSARIGLALAAAPQLWSGLTAEAEPPGETTSPKPAPTFAAFTESFQSWPIPKVCEKFKAIGLDGLDLTVRPGGHIEPEDAKAKLPGAVKAARDCGVRISMLSTAIVEPDKTAEALLATAGELGIDRVKLGYFRYEGFGTLAQQIAAIGKQLAGVAMLAAKHRVLPCVHIHSGDTIPGSGPIAYLLLKDLDPKLVGAYVDPMHMTIEGGNDGWRQGLDLLAPWIAISSLKNCKWITTGRDAHGQAQWATRKCPLADGVAKMPQYIATLDKLGYHGLFTLHSEYSDGNSWKVLNVDECLEQTRLDLEYVKKILQS
ncbi:MAG: TIM barrel protein [Pirellulales bacterium]